MKTLRNGALAFTGLAVAAFVILLAFAVTRLVQIEREMSAGAGEDQMYALAQAQFEGQRLALLANEWDDGAREPEAARRLQLQYDVTLSRLDLIAEGPMARRIAPFDPNGAISTVRSRLLSLDGDLARALARTAPTPKAALDEFLSDMAAVRPVANRVMLYERERAADQREQYRYVLLQAIVAMLGILVCGTFLVARLLTSLNRTSVAEASLRRDRDFSNLLLESSGDGIVVVDKDCRCTQYNAAMKALFPSLDGMMGQSLPETFGMKESHPVMVMLRQTLAGRSILQPAHPLPSSGRFIEKASFPIRSEGAVVGAIVFIRDVTETHKAQIELTRHRDQLEMLVQERTEDLRQAEARLRSAIQTAPDGFAAFDAEDRLVVANPKVQELLAERPGLFSAGASLSQIMAALGIAFDRQRIAEGGEEVSTTELQLPSGAWLLILLRRSGDGTSVMRLADVTRYKEATLTLEQSLKRETDLRELYRGFVSMVSHQFRTPLSIVDSGAQRMIRRSAEMEAGEIRERAGKIRAAAMRLTRLVSSTLNAARLDAGQIDVNIRRCDFAKLVLDACERQKESDGAREIEIRLDELPPAIMCDPLLVDQIISNLLSNAVKYSAPPQPIEVMAQAEGQWIHLHVRDRGVGIPQDETAHLFERFFRASTSAGVEGTGIGLYVARAIARMHGGDVTAKAREGGGSAFTLSLPQDGMAA